MVPFVTFENDFHATREEFFGCEDNNTKSCNESSRSDSQTAEEFMVEIETMKPRRHHRVRFQSVTKPKVLNPETEYFLEEECLVRWWTAKELYKIRQSIKTLCSRIRNPAECQDNDLITAHRKITLILASDFGSLMKMSRSLPNQDLAVWCSYKDGRRGLERYASKVYSCFRMHDIVETREAVLNEQSRQRSEGVNNPEIIAELCQRTSRRARSFAQFMAGADAAQIGNCAMLTTSTPPAR